MDVSHTKEWDFGAEAEQLKQGIKQKRGQVRGLSGLYAEYQLSSAAGEQLQQGFQQTEEAKWDGIYHTSRAAFFTGKLLGKLQRLGQAGPR